MLMRTMRLLLPLVVAFGFSGNAAADSNDDLLLRLNKDCLAAYVAGRDEFEALPGPLILVGDDLTFIWNGREAHASLTPPIYTTVKSLSHLFLGMVGILQPYLDDAAGNRQKWRPHLEAMRDSARLVMPHLGEFGLGGDSLARNRYLMEHLLAFIDRALAEGSYSRAALTGLARELAPLLLADADEAARAQIDMMDAAVRHWRAGLPPDVWRKVLVVIEGPHQPRVENLQYSYFRYALADPATQLVYAENVFNRQGALDLVGSVLADRSLAVIAFDEELRMERDLLGDAAEAYLMQLFGKLGRPLP
jgi:hypothetical protein